MEWKFEFGYKRKENRKEEIHYIVTVKINKNVLKVIENAKSNSKSYNVTYTFAFDLDLENIIKDEKIVEEIKNIKIKGRRKTAVLTKILIIKLSEALGMSLHELFSKLKEIDYESEKEKKKLSTKSFMINTYKLKSVTRNTT